MRPIDLVQPGGLWEPTSIDWSIYDTEDPKTGGLHDDPQEHTACRKCPGTTDLTAAREAVEADAKREILGRLAGHVWASVLAAAVDDAPWVAQDDVVLMAARGTIADRTPAAGFHVVTWTKDLDGRVALPDGYCLAVKADTVSATIDYGPEHFDAKVREYSLGANFDAFVDHHDEDPRLVPLEIVMQSVFASADLP